MFILFGLTQLVVTYDDKDTYTVISKYPKMTFKSKTVVADNYMIYVRIHDLLIVFQSNSFSVCDLLGYRLRGNSRSQNVLHP